MCVSLSGFGLAATLALAAAFVTSPAAAQTFLAKLTADDRTLYQFVGISVAIDDGVPVVGSFFSESSYLFDAAGNQTARLVPNAEAAAGGFFGGAVAVDDGVSLVGAAGLWSDDGRVEYAGSAYLFNAAGLQTARLIPDDGAAAGSFGVSVAVEGGVSLVGAPSDDDNGEGSGSAYLFDAAGNQTAKLKPADGAALDGFGLSVAIDGGIALVGATRHVADGVRAGAAYLFDTAGNQTAKLFAADRSAGDTFGAAVAIDDGVALVGAPNDDDSGDGSGSAYLFDAVTGQQLAKLIAPDWAARHQFGRSVAIDGGVALVGAYRDGDDGKQSGSAHLFDVATGQHLAKLLAPDGEAFDQFGRSVALEDGLAVVGAWQEGEFNGAAYLFDVSAFVVPEPANLTLAVLAMATMYTRCCREAKR